MGRPFRNEFRVLAFSGEKVGTGAEAGGFNGLGDVDAVAVAPDGRCRFAYSVDGISFTNLGAEFQSTVGRWVGATFGVFASAAPAPGTAENPVGAKSGPSAIAAGKSGHADFDWFHVAPVIP